MKGSFKHPLRLKHLLVCIGLSLLFACSSRHSPAPVETLSTKIASKNNLTEISGERYTVQRGDTLFAIAFYSGNDYRELAKLNQIQAPYALQVGQTLRLRPEQPQTIASTSVRPIAVASNGTPADKPAKISPSKKTSAKVATKVDTAQSAQKSTKVELDPPKKQAYGENEVNKHRKNQNKNTKSSIKSNKNRWIWPAQGEHTVATVGTDGSNRGLDIKGRLGSKILASANGKVVYAGNALKGYGNLVIIKHDDDYLSAYAHNERILVSEQSYVTQGQTIATMGQSGASEVMLHFEIRKKGKSQDPFRYLP